MFLVILFMFFIIIIGLIVYNQQQIKIAEASYPPKGKFVDTSFGRIHYLSAGEGQPAVFLHGGILSSYDFKDVIEEASKEGYHAIAFDRPGYGYSERPKEKITPFDQAEAVNEALEKIGVKKPILLVAHSWSGTMALSYTLKYPDKTAGVVLLGAAMYKEGYPAEYGDPLSKIITMPIIGSMMLHTLLKTPLGKKLAWSMTESTFAPEKAPSEYIEAVYALMFRPGQFRANREDVLAFPGASKKISEKYREISVPVLLAVGEEDPFGTIAQAERFKKEVPHAEYFRIPKVAHMLPELHPNLVVEYMNMLKESLRRQQPEKK